MDVERESQNSVTSALHDDVYANIYKFCQYNQVCVDSQAPQKSSISSLSSSILAEEPDITQNYFTEAHFVKQKNYSLSLSFFFFSFFFFFSQKIPK